MFSKKNTSKRVLASNDSEADLLLLLHATGVGIWSFDLASNAFCIDETCREMFDVEPGEELNLEVARERIHPDDLQPYFEAVNSSLETGESMIDYRIVRRDGTVRFMASRGRATYGVNGEITGTKGVCIDVTERKHLEDQLKSKEEQMQHLADGVPGLFSYIDRQYRVQFLSSQYREIFNRSAEETIGQHIGELVGEEAFLERKPRYDAALQGETVQAEATRSMPDGSELLFTVTHVPHFAADGTVRGVLSLAMDITERRQIEQALKGKSDELERSNRDLEQFAYIASHDLKAPLRAIEVLVDWLREDLQDNHTGDVQENLGLLSQRTQRLNKLLDDLLEYSRAGRQVGQVKRTDTREMVQDIATLLSPPEGMQIVADDSLPTLNTYGAPLEQVLRNLINNAIKHHPTQAGKVTVEAVDQAESVMFSVTDDGAGIPEQYAEKVFQMFQTLQPRDEREGSGMGLAVVKRIIEWQGGRIWFHPGPGNQGTVFKFVWQKSLPDMAYDPAEDQGTDNDDEQQRSQHLAG